MRGTSLDRMQPRITHYTAASCGCLNSSQVGHANKSLDAGVPPTVAPNAWYIPDSTWSVSSVGRVCYPCHRDCVVKHLQDPMSCCLMTTNMHIRTHTALDSLKTSLLVCVCLSTTSVHANTAPQSVWLSTATCPGWDVSQYIRRSTIGPSKPQKLLVSRTCYSCRYEKRAHASHGMGNTLSQQCRESAVANVSCNLAAVALPVAELKP